MSDGARDVPSPCIAVCELNGENICRGCGRSLAEISEWSLATPARQKAILDCAAQRRQLAESESS